ncbi:MAG: nuclear transport factor 2 family protein [Gaiellaceae bacterium]
MEFSEEIRRIVARWVTAVRDGDAAAVVARLSETQALLSIGTDPGEWWSGNEVAALWQRQLGEYGGFPFQWNEIEAWEEGTVGWGAARIAIATGDQAFEARATFVLHLEHGEWRVVQAHLSVPRANEEILGVKLPVSVAQLRETIERERPDMSSSASADGTVTVVFTDIVDSTVLNARLGDRAWRDVLLRHFAIIREAVAANGGTVVQTQGDGSMLAFSSARRALACCREIQSTMQIAFGEMSPPIRVRIGAHTGEALHEGDQFFGSTLNFAARVSSHAIGGEVLVSGLVHDLVAGDHGAHFVESRDVELKGFSGLHRLFALDVGS